MAGHAIWHLRKERLAVLTAEENEEQVMTALVERISKGAHTYDQICAELDVPRTTFLMWIQEDDARWNLFKKAHEARAMHLVSETIEIADATKGVEEASAVSAAKLRIDTRFKLAKHHAPELYGDKLDVTQRTDQLTEVQMIERIRALVEANPQLREIVVGSGVALTNEEEKTTVSDAIPETTQGE